MKEQLEQYVKALFEDAPKSRAALELREEVTANCIEKFQDLTSQGIAEDDAYQNVVEGIGNVADLFQGLNDNTTSVSAVSEEMRRKKTALLTSASVGMYIISGIIFLGIGTLMDEPTLGLLAGIGFAIIPTCILVYLAIAYPQYNKQDETIVESFKEWNHQSTQDKAVRGAISTILWMICLILYFVISFSTGAWYITWIIFLVFTCLEGIVTLLFSLKKVANK